MEAPLTRTQTRGHATVFLGGGRITNALIAGLRLAKYPSPILVYDRNPEKLRALRREFHVEVAHDLKSAAQAADMLIIAVRPVSVRDLLQELESCGGLPGMSGGAKLRAGFKPDLATAPNSAPNSRSVVISLAAGIPLSNLKALAPSVRWARAMPSPVCRSGNGLTGIVFDSAVPTSSRNGVRRFFAQVGRVLEISEKQFDAFTVTYSPSHGYHALAALAKAAQAAGLDRDVAMEAASHALGDAIISWRSGSSTIEELLHEAATPGGIAAATTMAMDRSGYSKAIRQALQAGLRQAERNAKT